jgi:hypothetical protein
MGCEAEILGTVELLAQFVSVLWQEWTVSMRAAVVGSNPQDSLFSISGACPHCACEAVFMPVTSIHSVQNRNPSNEHSISSVDMWAVLQCQGCRKYILGCVRRSVQTVPVYQYIQHFPLGKPKDDVPEEIPPAIGDDFKEALRCRWIEAYNATGEMCRRALEGSCNDKGAPTGKKLVEKIDWLASQGIITTALKDVAHKIRLGGNYGAHAPEDPLLAAPMTAEHADALIEFMRDYLQHVYIMPAKLAKYDFTKQGMNKPTP